MGKKFSRFFLLAFIFLNSCTNNNSSNPTGIYVPDDLEVTVFAETPLLYNPTNIDVDAKGRIWVTEAVNYRNYNNDSAHHLYRPSGDRVIILEDTDGDGKADSSKVFVQDSLLVAPLGIAVIGKKVVVSCSPNLIIYTDENGDDVADSREIYLTGFGGKDHDHSLHAVVCGPDGKWYFNTGNAGPHIVKDKSGWTLRSGSMYTGGSPYNLKNEGNMMSDDGKVWVGGLALQINPDGTGLKVLAHNFRNSYELAIDSYGNMWQNDNDDQVVTCRTSWLMENGNAGYFSVDGTRTWDADQRPGQDMFTAHWHQDDPGVMPAGDRTGAGAPTGIVINESDALGEKYRGLLLSADAGRNTIFGYLPKKMNSGYDLGMSSNFISSLKQDTALYVWNDTAANKIREKWFRPSDIAIGTEGAIYVADWFDPIVGGHAMDDSIGIGKIYRIVPKNKKLKIPRYNFNNIEGQIEALRSPAINVRYTAFTLLQRAGDTAIKYVESLLNDNNPYNRARAVWLLSKLGDKGRLKLKELILGDDEQLRLVAFRAIRQTNIDIIPICEILANDKSAFIRREVAIALTDSSLKLKKNILFKIAANYDGKDRWYLEAIGTAMDRDAGFWYDTLKNVFGKSDPFDWNPAMKKIAWRLHPPGALKDFVNIINSEKTSDTEKKSFLTSLAFIKTQEAAGAMLNFTRSADSSVATDAAYWASFRQGNDWATLLDWNKSGLNTHYEKKLASMKVKLQKMLDQRLSLDENRWNAEALMKDSIGGQMLIGLMTEDKIPTRLIPILESGIFNNPDITIRAQAGKYFKKPKSSKFYDPQNILALTGDGSEGLTTYTTRCGTCHKVGKVGNSIGPDLSAIATKMDKATLLDAILNPSAAIVFGYEPWLISTKDGQSVFGFLIADGKESVTIKDVAGQKHIIPVANLTKREKQQTSLMPEPSEIGLSEQDLANIIAFLVGNKANR